VSGRSFIISLFLVKKRREEHRNSGIVSYTRGQGAQRSANKDDYSSLLLDGSSFNPYRTNVENRVSS